MSAERISAIYNVRVVVRETGLRPDTLRAWERRYGVPRPVRSEGRQRRYSQQDVDQLRWLVERQREGMTIGRAVDLWNQLTLNGQDPLQTSPPIATPAVPPPFPHEIEEIRTAWVHACLTFDELSATACLTHAHALYSPEDVSLEVVLAGLADLGTLWYHDEASIQHEHFASELAVRYLERLLAASPSPWRSQRIIVACAPGEHHSLGGLLISALLRRHGYHVIFLGADVPAESVDAMLVQTQSDLVILIAQRLATAGTLLTTARLIARLGSRLAFGGGIFNAAPSVREKVPGIFLGENLRHVVSATERILARSESAFVVEEESDTFLPLRRAFNTSHRLIDAIVKRDLEQSVADQAQELAERAGISPAIVAALAFGDLTLLSLDIDWLTGFLTHRGIPSHALATYLATYRRSLRKILGDDRRLLDDLLERYEAMLSTEDA